MLLMNEVQLLYFKQQDKIPKSSTLLSVWTPTKQHMEEMEHLTGQLHLKTMNVLLCQRCING